jgi:hypothetical protein
MTNLLLQVCTTVNTPSKRKKLSNWQELQEKPPFSISLSEKNKNKNLSDPYLPTPLLEDPMVFPPSRERLPSGKI